MKRGVGRSSQQTVDDDADTLPLFQAPTSD
jgi:hypothetical protein